MEFGETLETRYSFYTIIGLVFSVVYIGALLFIIVVDESYFSIAARDRLSGLFWSLVFYGTPVMMLVGGYGYIQTKEGRKRGRVFSLITLIAPLVFVLATMIFWPVFLI